MPEKMKLLAEEDKKYKKIPKREQKGVKEACHRTTIWICSKLKDQCKKNRSKPPSL
jgi:hypothetical protein